MDVQNIKAHAEMLIRKPVSEVFEAVVNPEITSKFWFSKGSARLEQGKKVHWVWEMYNFSMQAVVKALETNKRVVVEWGNEEENPTMIEWVFTERDDNTTYLSISNYGFKGDEDAVIQHAIGSTEGFTFYLAGLKAWLEHGVQLNLVPDKFPDGLPS